MPEYIPCVLIVEGGLSGHEGAMDAFASTVSPVNVEFVEAGRAHSRLAAGAPQPDLILLDMVAACDAGVSLLRQLKSDEELKRIPVVAFCAPEDIDCVREAYDARANACVARAASEQAFISQMASLARFWLRVVISPVSSPFDRRRWHA